MEWKVEQIPELKGYTVEWAEPDNYYLSHRNRLYHSSTLEPPFTEIGRVDAPLWKELASKFRLGQRLLRFLFYNIIPLANGEIFATFDKTVGIFKNGEYKTLHGLVRPCRVLRSGCAVDKKGNVFFGEYLANNERGEMRIYKYPSGGDSLEVVHLFPSGSIKHIHGLYFDKYASSIFCLTGDADSECRIICTTDGFATIETIGEGDETWRAVSILFDKDSFYYGTDAEYRTNQIFRVNREKLAREPIGEVNGTVFYSKQIGNDMFFTTTAENAPSQMENVAAIWHVDAKGRCKQLVSFKKDRWPGGLFMFGMIHLPYVNALGDRLYFSLVGVRDDAQTFCISSA